MYSNKTVKAVKNSYVIELENAEKTISLSVYPPTIKAVKKMQKLNTESDDVIDEMVDIISSIISNNKEHITLTAEDLEELLDFEDVTNLFSDISRWIADIKKK